MTADEEEDRKTRRMERAMERAIRENEKQWREFAAKEPATAKQLAYARKLGAVVAATASKLEASDAISAAIEGMKSSAPMEGTARIEVSQQNQYEPRAEAGYAVLGGVVLVVVIFAVALSMI